MPDVSVAAMKSRRPFHFRAPDRKLEGGLRRPTGKFVLVTLAGVSFPGTLTEILHHPPGAFLFLGLGKKLVELTNLDGEVFMRKLGRGASSLSAAYARRLA